MVEFDRSAFIGKFQEEAQDLLQRLNEGVINLEADPGNHELINQMMRDAHTVKGSSRMVGLIEISDIAHRLEDFMIRVRDGEMTYIPQMSDYFFEALDAIVFLTENAGENVGGALDIDTLEKKLAALAEGGAKGAKAFEAGQPVVPLASSTAVVPQAAVQPDVRSGSQSASETEPSSPSVQYAPNASTSEDVDVEDERSGDGESDDAAAADKAGHSGKGKDGANKGAATIRIKTAQVDDLLNLISEVVINQIKDEQRSNELRALQTLGDDLTKAWGRLRALIVPAHSMQEPDPEVAEIDNRLGEMASEINSFARDFIEDSSRGSLLVNDLQEQGMRLRMLPANTIFQAFPRAMRDLAKHFKKEIDFTIEGGDTELDKKVLEEINDPLVHIMRNAVDHGIESAEQRVALGKPAHGTIRLAARQEGDRIVIEVQDDGAGIDPEKVKASALKKGYITEAEASSMTDREAMYLIFEAGFSTAAIITEISGRGVGMDVVREFVVEKLKGSLDVESVVGEGTTFKLTIPLTLAIIRALLLTVGDQTLALPTSSIEETLRVAREDIMKVEGREAIRRQRRTVPLVRLSTILGISESGVVRAKVPIVTLGDSGHRMGFIVDSFEGEQQIVIKPLGTHLKKIDNVAGVTVLGAGQVIPILNVPDLMVNARARAGQRVGPTPRSESKGPRKILICEDSFTTRELERSIFEAAGYVVETAVDGAQGLSKLREGLAVEAVVTDVQMPNMTGFQLTKAIKSDPALQAIPVIIVTSLERDEEKAEGVEAGADAYITKSVFNQDTLLDTVERLIR